jgi:hypothetical protein
VQAAGDARENHRKIGGAEAGSGEDGIGGDALADRRDECRAVVDQLADEGEQAAGAAGLGVELGGWLWGGGCSWHQRNKNTGCGLCQVKFTLAVNYDDKGWRSAGCPA